MKKKKYWSVVKRFQNVDKRVFSPCINIMKCTYLNKKQLTNISKLRIYSDLIDFSMKTNTQIRTLRNILKYTRIFQNGTNSKQ